jgi:hypothetical protein
MSTPDDMAMAMTLMAQYDQRAAKEARGRRRQALTRGEGTEAKYWRAVHKQIVKIQSDQPHKRDRKGKS